MLDGLDEVPRNGRAANGRDALIQGLVGAANDFLQRCAMVVTARPDSGEHGLGWEVQRLQSLTAAQWTRYIRVFFEREPEKGEFLLREIPRWPAAGELLRLPLTLALTCEFVLHWTRTPGSISDLMEIAVTNLHERRGGSVDAGEHARLRKGLEELCFVFSERQFCDLSRNDVLAPLVNAPEPGRDCKVLDLAEQLGMLRSLPTRPLRMFKGPVVEYLAGCHLAELEAKHLLEVFCAWVWQPEYHEILRFAFAKLWSSGGSRLELAAKLSGLLLDHASAALAKQVAPSVSVEPPIDDLSQPLVFRHSSLG